MNTKKKMNTRGYCSMALLGILMTTADTSAVVIHHAELDGWGRFGEVGGATANPSLWGDTDIRRKSAAFALYIDYDTTVANSAVPVHLFNLAGGGENSARIGSALVLEGSKLHFFVGDTNANVVSGDHGLSPKDLSTKTNNNNVQILTTVRLGAGTGGNDLISIYADGTHVATADLDIGPDNEWSGPGASGLGRKQFSWRYQETQLFGNTAPPGAAPNGNDVTIEYPHVGPGNGIPNNENISFFAFWLAEDGGPAENTIDNILAFDHTLHIPEPSVAALLLPAGLLFLSRRRKRS